MSKVPIIRRGGGKDGGLIPIESMTLESDYKSFTVAFDQSRLELFKAYEMVLVGKSLSYSSESDVLGHFVYIAGIVSTHKTNSRYISAKLNSVHSTIYASPETAPSWEEYAATGQTVSSVRITLNADGTTTIRFPDGHSSSGAYEIITGYLKLIK